MSGIFDQIINYSPPLIVSGTVNYKGTWNASTNNPTLNNPPAASTKGDYYVVSTAGTQFSITFGVGDWIISNGTAWEKVDLTDAVSSVFGRTGAVVGVSTDYSAVGLTNTAIGASSPSTGAFTSLSSSSTTTLNGTTVPASKTLVVTTDKLSALAATTSAELAGVISDETGSGALVFANSPTLVTPALGTPSSGTVTNLTGTASININGTVGATTPSTGAFTTLSATGAATFSVDATINGVKVGKGGGSIASNTALGSSALNANTTAVANTAIGFQALFNSTIGGSNTAVGYQSLFSNISGSNNTAFGREALKLNTTGVGNTAIGYQSLFNNTTGVGNTANGRDALKLNTTGSNNTAIGRDALTANTTGGNNTANGYQALTANTTGALNTAIGRDTLLSNTTGGNNTAIGYNAGNAITTGSNNTIVGNHAGTAAMANNIVLADGAGNIRYQWDGTNNVFTGAASFSSSLAVTGTLSATALTVNDNTTLGSSNTDTVNFNARVASDLNPATDDTYDLGVTGHEWRNLNIDGTANIDSLVADSADINGGTIDGTAIGGSTAAAGAFTTLSATGTVTSAIADKISLSGVGASDQYFLGANYTNADGTESVTTAARASWRFRMKNVATNEASIDFRAANAATNAFTAIGTFTSTGLAVTGALSSTGTITSTSTGRNAFSGAIQVTGANPTNVAASTILDNSSGDARIICYGLNTSTRGTFTMLGISSDGSLNSTYFTANSTGLAVTGALSATGNVVAFSDSANGNSAFESTFSGTTRNGLDLADSTDTSGVFFGVFRKASGTAIGSITRVTTTDAVIYNTTSDGRLKENLRDFTDSGRLIDSLKPRLFDWKNSDENGKNVVGFIAQEEHAADPIFAHIGAVSVGDEDPDTITKQWQRSDSALIPILVAELKSLRARVAALESK